MKKHKALRVLVIIYLLLAVVYSINVLPKWILDVVALKANGGSDLEWRLNNNEFNLGIRSISTKKKNFEANVFTFSSNRTFATIKYSWKKRNAQFVSENNKLLTKSNNEWAIIARFESGEDEKAFRRLEKTLRGLKINKQGWHFGSELRLFFSLDPIIFNKTPTEIGKNLVGHGNPVGFIIFLCLIALFAPVHAFYVLMSAILPYPFVYVTIFVPLGTFVFLTWILLKGLIIRGKNAK